MVYTFCIILYALPSHTASKFKKVIKYTYTCSMT